MPALPVRKQENFTYKDYLQFPDELRCEIIGGKIYDMMPAPTIDHQRIAGKIYRLAADFLDGKDLPCEALIAPIDVCLSDRDIVQPDVVIVCERGKIQRQAVFGAPDVVFEVLSPGIEVKDRKMKMELYTSFGVREYFLVNPDLQFVEKHIVHENGHRGVWVYHGTETFMVDTIGLELTAQDLFPGHEQELQGT